VSDKAKYVAVYPKDHRVLGITEAHRARRHHSENTVHVRRRVRDDPQDFCGGGLLFPCFR
jgi:hypothetical protein